MKKKLVFLTASFFITFGASSQPLGVPSTERRVGSVKLIAKESVSEAERQQFWENRIADQEGYTRLISSEKYVNLIESFEKIPVYNNASVSERSQIGNFKLSGKIDEDLNRKTLIFTDENDQKMMLTVWKYKDAGATINIPSEFVVDVLKSNPSIFCLVTSPDSSKALWKAATWNSDYFIEVYVEDFVSKAGNASRSYASIQSIVKNASKIYMQ